MALKKLNKAEVSALANKIKGMMKDTNEEVKRQALYKQKPSILQSAGWILDEISDLSANAQAYVTSLRSAYNPEITKEVIVEFLEARFVEKLVLPYTTPEENWRGANRIEEEITLAQLEADSVEALINAVKTAFTGGK